MSEKKKFIATKNTSVHENLKCVLSRSLIGKIKQNGSVFVDDKFVKMSHVVCIGEEILISFPKRAKQSVSPFDFPLEIIYEDDDLIVVQKPSGMQTHCSRSDFKSTLENAYCGLLVSRGESVENFTFHPITRLDCETSGLVLICKNPISTAKISEDMKSGKIKKQYIALANGEIKSDFKTELYMDRVCEKSPHRWIVDGGKYSETAFKIIEKVNGDMLVAVFPKTGRTHQIRVHLAFCGHAIVGDKLYQNGGLLQGEKPDGRLMLFMHALEFENMNGEKINVQSKCDVSEYIRM
ncbi:MAG: RluA family pseudouridine synthase [Bacillota bacterium]